MCQNLLTFNGLTTVYQRYCISSYYEIYVSLGLDIDRCKESPLHSYIIVDISCHLKGIFNNKKFSNNK